MNIKRTVNPTVEPVTSAEFEEQMVISSGWDSSKVTRNLKTAREMLEIHTDRSLITQTWVMKLDKFPESGIIYLPKGITQSITSIKYYDTDDALQTLAATQYDVVINADIARVSYSEVSGGWVSVSSNLLDAIEITYVTGYGSAATDVPEWAKDAIIAKATSLYSIGDIDTTDMYKSLIEVNKIYFDYAIND